MKASRAAIEKPVDVCVGHRPARALYRERIQVQERIVVGHTATLLQWRGPQLRDGFAGSGDRDPLAALGPRDQLRQASLRIVDVHNIVGHGAMLANYVGLSKLARPWAA